MPYSGKTTIGELLSKKIKCNFLDTDEKIEKEYKSSISDIFANQGEDYFRIIERNLVNELYESKIRNTVISTGGGMPIFYDNINGLNKIGTTIFIDTNLESLVERLAFNKNRPLLIEEPVNKLIDLYYTRRNIYMKSHKVIKLRNETPSEIVNNIIIKLDDIKETNNNVCK